MILAYAVTLFATRGPSSCTDEEDGLVAKVGTSKKGSKISLLAAVHLECMLQAQLKRRKRRRRRRRSEEEYFPRNAGKSNTRMHDDITQKITILKINSQQYRIKMYSVKVACCRVLKSVSIHRTGKGRCIAVTWCHFMGEGALLCVRKCHKRKELPCCIVFCIFTGRPGVRIRGLSQK